MTNEDLYTWAQILPEFGPPTTGQPYNSGSMVHGCAGYEIGTFPYVTESAPLSLYMGNKFWYRQATNDVWKANTDHDPVQWSHGVWTHRMYFNVFGGGHGWSWKVTGPGVTNGELIAHADGIGKGWQHGLFTNLTLYPQEQRGYINPTIAGGMGGHWRPGRVQQGWGVEPMVVLNSTPRWVQNSYCHAVVVTEPEYGKVTAEIWTVPEDFNILPVGILAEVIDKGGGHLGSRQDFDGLDFNHHDPLLSTIARLEMRYNAPTPGVIGGQASWVDPKRQWRGGYFDMASSLGGSFLPFFDKCHFFDAADGANTFTNLTDLAIWEGGPSGPTFSNVLIVQNIGFANIFVLVSNWDATVAPAGAAFNVTTAGITGPTNCNGTNLQCVVVGPSGPDYVLSIVVPEVTVAGSYSGGTTTVQPVKVYEEANWRSAANITGDTIAGTMYLPASSTLRGSYLINTSTILQTDSKSRFGLIVHRDGTNLKGDSNYACLGAANDFAVGLCGRLYGTRFPTASEMSRELRLYMFTRVPSYEPTWAGDGRSPESALFQIRNRLDAATKQEVGSATPISKGNFDWSVAFMCVGSLQEVKNQMIYLSDNGYLDPYPQGLPT